MNEKDRQHIIDTFCELVAIDNPSLDERAMADEIKRRLGELGISVTEDDSWKKTGGTAGNLFARIPGEPDTEPVLFSGHLDSVAPAVGKKAILQADGRITSDGTTVLGADDLAGLTEILEAIRILKETGTPHRPIELVITCAEELYDVGSEFFDYSQLTAKEGYVLDSTGPLGFYIDQAPSIISFEVKVHGRAAHAGFSPEAGIHAIRIAAEAVTSLRMGHVDEATTMNVGEIKGGEGTNIIPELCTVRGEIRSWEHDRALEALSMVRKVFEEKAEAYGGSITFSSRSALVAYSTPKDAPAVQNMRAACGRLRLEPKGEASFGGSDMSGFAQHGIMGLVLASGMTKSHSVEEYVTVDDLVKATELVMELMKK